VVFTTESIKEFISNLMILCKGHLRQLRPFVSLSASICDSPRGSLFRSFLTRRLLSLLDDEYLLPLVVALGARDLIEINDIIVAIYAPIATIPEEDLDPLVFRPFPSMRAEHSEFVGVPVRTLPGLGSVTARDSSRAASFLVRPDGLHLERC
jgi:hypothetical protein